MTELSLYKRCLSFVEDQSSGEWGSKIEQSDALKLVAFIQALFPMERVERIPELLEANNRYLLRARQSEKSLKKLLEMYIAMVNSGDCGNWNPEEEEEVIEARNALDAPWT